MGVVVVKFCEWYNIGHRVSNILLSNLGFLFGHISIKWKVEFDGGKI